MGCRCKGIGEPMSKIIWRAEITEDMVAHLGETERNQLMNDLSDAVNQIGQEAGVGREYENGKLKENNYA
jgi:hypothetical protein